MLEMNTIKRHFIGILLLVCATVVAQTPSGKPTVTTYKFGPNDERHVDMEDADVCVEAGRFYYEQAFKAGSLEEASVLLNQSITLLQRALELRTKNGLASERAIVHNHLAEAFMAAARLFPNDIRTVTAYHRKAAEQEEAILEDCKPVNERNKDTVAEAAYRLTEILLLLNDDLPRISMSKPPPARLLFWVMLTPGTEPWRFSITVVAPFAFSFSVSTEEIAPVRSLFFIVP